MIIRRNSLSLRNRLEAASLPGHLSVVVIHRLEVLRLCTAEWRLPDRHIPAGRIRACGLERPGCLADYKLLRFFFQARQSAHTP